ncbi:MAG: apolipoprotein N-acyltransferase [Pyrinomonadaceae bacterium]
MKIVSSFKTKLPSLKNSLLAIFSAILLILAFPDFEIWFLAYIALVPLFYAVEREKESVIKSFALGWVFGTAFFFGSCWWLAFPMTHYASIPAPIAYSLVLLATLTVGLIPAIFTASLSILLKRFGTLAILAAPFLWTATEFLRFYVTGNNWNAIAYSQAFDVGTIKYASIGGIYLVGFLVVFVNVWLPLLFYYPYLFWEKTIKKIWANILQVRNNESPRLIETDESPIFKKRKKILSFILLGLLAFQIIFIFILTVPETPKNDYLPLTRVIAIQPNVPMSGLKYEDWQRLRERHVQLSEQALQSERATTNNQLPTTIIFPESPMNFEYARDREFQEFIKNFTAKNNVSVLFNAAEPALDEGVYNSAVLVGERGERIAQYDKIHLLPFGEFVPLPSPLAEFVPPVVGNFEFGKTYDLIPLGNGVQAGVMICFESHFPTLSREYAREGADVLVELTNDGYLGNTPVLRQHLANAVFRAVETNHPVLRVTNVGITAFINERGEVLDATKPYTEDTRVWTISKSGGARTFYVKYGDWFAWLCSSVSLILLAVSFWKKLPQKFTKDTN